jgi:MFS transporter, FSR family, fosmidomycin resistance protein
MAAVAAVPAAGIPADRRGIVLLTLSHIVNDANQSALPAIIPWLIAHRGLSLASAATLVLAMNLSSSIVQPLFGHLSDRRSLAWVMPLAILLAAFGTSVIGFATSMPLMLTGALISGIGVAAFHPEGSRFANYFGGAHRATAMGWFSTGGYLGFALGPIMVTPAILIFGLHGAAIVMIPAVVFAFLMWRDLPRFDAARARVFHAHHTRSGFDDWRAFWILSVVVALRSTMFFAAVTFMPLFAIGQLHVSKAQGSMVLALMLVAGAFTTWWGGRLGDRVDRRSIVTVSITLTGILAIAIALTGAFLPSLWLLVPLAIGLGAALGLSASVIVVLGQEYLPTRIGVASGMTLGLSVTIGGLAAPLFGTIGDRYGLIALFLAIAAFAVLALIGSFFTPKPAEHLQQSVPL